MTKTTLFLWLAAVMLVAGCFESETAPGPAADAAPPDTTPIGDVPSTDAPVVSDVPVTDGMPDVPMDVQPDTPPADIADAPSTDVCAAPMSMCDGACVNTQSDAANCGGCGRACACPTGQTPSCTTGTCSCECPAGMVAVGDTCAPIEAPRPTFPLSTMVVTSRRPTLRWERNTRLTGAHVELCRDRACTMVIDSFDASGSFGRPPRELPASRVVFWRLRGRVGDRVGMTTSRVWQFTVGARSATGDTDTAWGTSLKDLNGDGYADLAVGAASRARRVEVFAGGPSELHAPTTLFGSSGMGVSFGNGVAMGDLNGDGFADLAVGSYGEERVYVFEGRSAALPTTATTVISPAGATALQGPNVFDLDGNGFDDLLVADRNRLYVYNGSASGLAATPSSSSAVPVANTGFGVAGGADVNGDGFVDVVIGAICAPDPTDCRGSGQAYLYLGGPTGIGSLPDRTISHPQPYARFGSRVTGVGDINGDGYGDVAIGAYGVGGVGGNGGGAVYLYLGGREGLGATAAVTWTGTGSDGVGDAVTATDVNGDGLGDIIIGAGSAGRASLHPGVRDGRPPPMPTMSWGGRDGGSFGAFSVAGQVGDLNGDGFGDVVISAFDAGETGRVYVYPSSPSGLPMLPAQVLNGTEMGAQYGYSLAFAAPVRPWFTRGDRARARVHVPRIERRAVAVGTI